MIRPKCTVDGCVNIAMNLSKGRTGKFCSSHHKKKYGQSNLPAKRRRKSALPNKQCAICGWHGPCDRHRVIAGAEGGKYVLNNVVSLCPNCHRLLHLG